MTKQQFLETLERKGFKLRGTYPNQFIYDGNGRSTKFRVLNDSISITTPSSIDIYIGFDGIKIEEDDFAITVTDINSGENTSFFVNFYLNPYPVKKKSLTDTLISSVDVVRRRF